MLRKTKRSFVLLANIRGKMTKNAYIHIPFCASKCKYCAFVSFDDKLHLQQEYFKSLFDEIEYCYNGELLKTLYIGGGTPSLVESRFYKELFARFNFEKGAEITLEVNPATVNQQYLKELFDIGINRLSIGVQSFDDDILKIIGRRHTSEQAIETIEIAEKAGFKNISIDLIYGLPTQTIKQWHRTLEQVAKLNISHISTYGLKIEEGTYFYKNLPENLPEEDDCAQMYLDCIDMLKESGFHHYEISNFAKSGFESQHNITYWKNSEYYGFGAAAHGYTNGQRYSNTTDFDLYLKNPLNRESVKTLSEVEKFEEEIFLGLRLAEGIELKNICKKYNYSYSNFENTIKKFAASTHLEEQNGKLYFSRHGFLVSNYILTELLDCITK